MQLRGRTRSRAQALQLLFQAEVNKLSVDELLEAGEYAIDPGPLDDYAKDVALGTDGMRDTLDELIEERSEGWPLSRMPNCDRNILRMALYEMLAVDEVDLSVSIDEAVNLANFFGTDDSSRFINGILGRMADEIEAGEAFVDALLAQASQER